MPTLAHRFSKILSAGALAEVHKDWSDGGDGGCYNDNVHLDATQETVSLQTVENARSCFYCDVYVLTRSTLRARWSALAQGQRPPRSTKYAEGQLQVMSVVALTVIGTFDVLTAAHTPALW